MDNGDEIKTKICDDIKDCLSRKKVFLQEGRMKLDFIKPKRGRGKYSDSEQQEWLWVVAPRHIRGD
jgi:hypothetical protein